MQACVLRRIRAGQLILFRTFQRARRFLLPILRLRLDFAMHHSRKLLSKLVSCAYTIRSWALKSRKEVFFLGEMMILCKDCELFEIDPNGRRIFHCDPFINIKEPECLVKWQLLRLDLLVSMYRGMTAWQEKMGPIQDKILKYVKRELEDLDESESWKIDPENPEDPAY